MKRKITLIILSLLIISSGIILWLYEKHKKQLTDQPPYFDLFIAETLFEPKPEEIWMEFWGSAWNNVDISQKRIVDWKINKNEFETLDSIYLGFKNTSNEKFYYVTWGQPNSRIRISFNVYKNGKIDSIPFGGFGCGTGIQLNSLKTKEVAGSKFLNPLMFNPYTGYNLPLKNKNFPKLFKEIYGDSIAIKFEQATYSLPWNSTPSQMISSDQFIISTERIIENWKNGNFSSNKEFEEEYENGYFINENGVFKTSSLYNKKKRNPK